MVAYFSKDMNLFKVDIPQMGQTSTLVPASSLLLGLTPRMCPLQSLLHTGRHCWKPWYVPISSPKAWGENQVKRYSIISFHGKASSHGKRCSYVALPPSAIVYLFRLRVKCVISIPYFPSQCDCRLCIPGKQFLNHRVEPNTRSEEEPSFCRDQVGTEEVELPSIWEVQAKLVAMAMACCPPSIVTPQTLCEKKGSWWAQVGSSHRHTTIDVYQAAWAHDLEVCWYEIKGWSIGCIGYFDDKYSLQHSSHWHHFHQAPEYINIHGSGLLLHYDISKRDQWAYHFQSFPTGEKSLPIMTGMRNLIPELKPWK